MVWGGIVGQQVNPSAIYEVVKKEKWVTWKPDFIVLHNTAVPSLAQRPQGFTKAHIDSLEGFYRDVQGWSSGPHFFVDDKSIWLFSPMTKPGTHSPSWNRVSIGIEMLGDYAKEEFTSGRGALVRANTVKLMAALGKKLNLIPSTFRYHVSDPKTDHDCPGIKARRDRLDFVIDINHAMSLLDAPPDVKTESMPFTDLHIPPNDLPPWGGWDKDKN
jgi:N-acetylmuramoyl-L-alanine amidase CwlA